LVIERNKKMSERNDQPSLQNLFSQFMREVQNGFTQLEQKLNEATQQPQTGGFPPPGSTESPPPPQTQPAPKPAEPYHGAKWEYKVVYVNFRGQISADGEQVIIGRGERRSSFVRQYLDELGQQGWELSGISPLAETENSYFIFKRPSTGDKPPTQAASRNGQRVRIEEVDENNPVAEV
jgi:hypothetical protein